ncbi:MAG: MaoC/PaaZ C-terminal domain-containing protein [Frisingicoccus sp.]
MVQFHIGHSKCKAISWMPLPASMLADEIIKPTVAFLVWTMRLSGTGQSTRSRGHSSGRIRLQTFDRGEGKGAVVKTKVDVRDEAGNLVCTNYSTTFFHEAGGFGGKPMPKNPIVIPDRAPDAIVEDYISPVQNLLYRLTGDTNLIHVDPEYAKDHKFDQPIIQGLCSFGFSCRMAIDALIPGEPERVTRMAAQMRNVLLPDTPVALHIWKEEEGKALFQFVDTKNNRPVLDRGVFEWK